MGGSSQTTGWNYRLAWLHMLGMGPWDTFREFRGADKTIWKGRITANTALVMSAPKLWGGDKDQGGVEGTLRLMFGEADQLPNAYASATWGSRTAAYRGFMTAAWEGGIWGANNPWAQKCSYRGERYIKGWDNDDPWYPETCPVPIDGDFSGGSGGGDHELLVTGDFAVGDDHWAAHAPGTDTWVPLLASSGADMLAHGTPAYWRASASTEYWSALGPANATRYSVDDRVSFLPGTVVGDIIGGAFVATQHVGGPAGFLARSSAGQLALSNFPPDVYTIIDGVGAYNISYSGGSDGWYYLQQTYALVRTKDFVTFQTLYTSGDNFDGYLLHHEVVYFGGAYYATRSQQYVYLSRKHQLVRSVNGHFSGDVEVLIDLPPDTGKLSYLQICGPVLVVYKGGGFIYRSTDNFAEAIEIGLSAPETYATSDEMRDAVANRKVACNRNGRLFILGTAGGEVAYTDDFENFVISATGQASAQAICGPGDGEAGEAPTYARYAKNPAHMILERHTQQHAGRQPRSSVNLDHLTVAADWFYGRGFGLCTFRNSKDESPRQYIKRIEKVAGCSFTKSLDDGLWYLDVANGIYDLESLEVINDDHVLKFKETGTVPDNAVNSVSVKYFDPERKETIITPPIRAMGLIAQFGEIHQTFDYPEVPIGRIALEIATRELLARITPTRTFELDCNPGVYRLRKNQYVRLQLPKRGIADMVCIVGDIPTSGSLKSGAFQLKLTQDIYSLPTTEYVVELGEDTRPPTTPAEIVSQIAFEAPYIDVVASMPAADFAALPADAGYVLGAAVDPGRMRDFTMMVAPDGGDYDDVGDGQFCPSCTVTGLVEPGLQEGIGFSNPSRMASVQVGDVGWWDGELVRVDVVDLDANTLDLGRGCGDTLPRQHLANSRIFFYQSTAAFDRTQHIAGEALDVKLLTNSYSEQMDLADAEALPVTMAQRIERPYNNADMKINGVSIFAIGTSTPGGGGGGPGGPGGGGPTSPPATGSNGAPASQELGPLGGFPDNGPPLYPQPTTFGVNVIDDPSMDDPATLSRWRKKDGTPLGPEWSLVGGKLQLQAGVGTYEAYDFGTRFSKPYMPFPRLVIDTAADVQNTPGTLSSIGVAWGTWQSSNMPEYLEVSGPVAYLDEDTVTHTWAQEIKHAGGGVGIIGEYSVINFVPMVRHVVTTELATATIDNVDMQITLIDPAVTAETIINLDLSAGLTGITLWPDPSDTNPYLPDISVVGGVAIADFHTEGFDYRWLIWDDPLTEWDLDHFARFGLEGWSNDATILSNSSKKLYPFGGVTAGLAYKNPGGDLTAISAAGRVERGDFTPREYCHHIAHTAASGFTVHAAVLMVGSVGTQAKFRNLTAASTNAAYPESP